MSENTETFFNCLPGIIMVAGIAVYQVIEDCAARKIFERERKRWTHGDAHTEWLESEVRDD